MTHCSNCDKASSQGGANGLCARCYQYNRRNGHLPPSELLVGHDLNAQLTVRVEAPLLRAVEKAAKRDSCTVAEWVRRAMFEQSRKRA